MASPQRTVIAYSNSSSPLTPGPSGQTPLLSGRLLCFHIKAQPPAIASGLPPEGTLIVHWPKTVTHPEGIPGS